MNIVTKRCEIREFTIQDINRFMEYRNDRDWMRYQGFKDHTKEVYEKALLKDSSMESGMQFAIINSDTKQLIGDIYLKKESDTYRLGYSIHPQFARQGYAMEAVTATIDWIASQGGIAVKAGVLPGNIPSINLLNKLSFLYAGKEKEELVYVLEIKSPF